MPKKDKNEGELAGSAILGGAVVTRSHPRGFQLRGKLTPPGFKIQYVPG